MDDNMNNDNMGNELDESSFGSSNYYKKLYDDMPEDVAEMLIGTHPLMKKEVSDELSHSIKIRSAREKNRRAVSEEIETLENTDDFVEQKEDIKDPEQRVAPSKDPVDANASHARINDENIEEYVGDITSFTRGLVASPTGKKKKDKQERTINKEETVDEKKSDDDITAEMIAKMLGGGDVTPVDENEYDEFDLEEPAEEPIKSVKSDVKQNRRSKKKHKNINERDLELSNIDKQANLNELFREDDDYYDEKHSSISVARIAIIVAAIVVFAFLIYKAASLTGQVSKLNEQIETYKTMEQEYEQLKLDNLSLKEQVESLNSQLGGGTSNGDDDSATAPASTNNNSSGNNSSSNNSSGNNSSSSQKTYTVKYGDTYWGIATKEYGNGSYYTKILSANGLSENDKLKEGMTLTIPAL